MTAQDKINFIREKCIESNPEIVELKFGCFVVVKGEHRMITQECIGGFRALTIIEDEGDMVYAYPQTFYQKEEMEVIGRFIRLADVFKTFDGLTMFGALPIGPQIENVLQLYGQVAGYWKLADDNLERHDEPAINFVYDTLK